MNIHKSAIITVSLGCIFATQAYASNKLESEVQSCSDLYVHISKSILDDYTLTTNQIGMVHGDFLGCGARDNTMHCQFEQNEVYGPDVILPVQRKTDGQRAIINVRQNFCFWEAGSITVEPVRGKWVYRTREGSYGINKGGHVWLEKVSLNN